MSGLVKKIAKSVKKVFKKVVKVIKKVLKSKLFKIAVVAAAIYFGGAALLAAGGAGGAGAAAAAPISELAVTAAPNVVTSAASTAAAQASGSSVLGNGVLGTIAKGAGTAAKSLFSGNQLLASTALNMGGSYMQAKADAQDKEDAEAQMKVNNNTNLGIYNRTMNVLDESGWRDPNTGAIGQQGVDTDQMQQQALASRQETAIKESNSAMAGISRNVQQSYNKPVPNAKAPKFFNNANNKWQKVKAA